MRRALYVLLLAPAVAVGVACGTSYSSSTAPAPDGGVDGSIAVEAAATATSPCPVGCLLPPPSGWTGPSTILETELGAAPSVCPLAYPTREADSFHADGGPATCSCMAPAPAEKRFISAYTNGTCTAGAASTVINGGCDPLPTGAFAFIMPIVSRAALDASAGVEGCCSTPILNGSVPPIDETVVTSCGARVSSACPGRTDCNAVTTPDQPFERVCIHADGEVACPNADYPNRFVSYRTVTDGRSCTDCTATTQTGICEITAWPSVAACQQGSVSPQLLAADGGCTTVGQVETVVAVNATQKCAIDGGGPTGTIDLADAITYCCAN